LTTRSLRSAANAPLRRPPLDDHRVTEQGLRTNCWMRWPRPTLSAARCSTTRPSACVSARGSYRVLRARTLADLAGVERARRLQIAEALSYRRIAPGRG